MHKPTSTTSIRKLCSSLCPELDEITWHESRITASTWKSGLETGKAVEYLALCALIRAYNDASHITTYPPLYAAHPDLFYLRNVIPRPHGAQAGHDSHEADSVPLALRFLAAFVPKVIFRQPSGGDSLLLFREGHPVHFINHFVQTGQQYLERPDLIIAEGQVESELNSDQKKLSFSYAFGPNRTVGVLRIMNHAEPPLIQLDHVGMKDIPIAGFVECSVGKQSRQAATQLTTYSKLCKSSTKPVTALVNGRRSSNVGYDVQITLDLSNEGQQDLESSILRGTKVFCNELRRSLHMTRPSI